MRPPIAPALVRRAALALAGAASAVALAAPAPASAAESAMPTAQAKAYGMDWVPYIDPADLPPVEQRKVICLVDSGVEVNPDLPADRPEGPIVCARAWTTPRACWATSPSTRTAPAWRPWPAHLPVTTGNGGRLARRADHLDAGAVL